MGLVLDCSRSKFITWVVNSWHPASYLEGEKSTWGMKHQSPHFPATSQPPPQQPPPPSPDTITTIHHHHHRHHNHRNETCVLTSPAPRSRCSWSGWALPCTRCAWWWCRRPDNVYMTGGQGGGTYGDRWKGWRGTYGDMTGAMRCKLNCEAHFWVKTACFIEEAVFCVCSSHYALHSKDWLSLHHIRITNFEKSYLIK